MDKKIYALYKGDAYLTDGTLEELAEYLKVKKRTIQFYMRPVYKKRCKKGNCRKIIYIGSEANE